jgi:hypothetical protein
MANIDQTTTPYKSILVESRSIVHHPAPIPRDSNTASVCVCIPSRRAFDGRSTIDATFLGAGVFDEDGRRNVFRRGYHFETETIVVE